MNSLCEHEDVDIKLLGRKAFPFSGCDCLWCVRAAHSEERTLWPACNCAKCESHILWRQPEHFMRQCKHGRRWTNDQNEGDECGICRLDNLESRLEISTIELCDRLNTVRLAAS